MIGSFLTHSFLNHCSKLVSFFSTSSLTSTIHHNYFTTTSINAFQIHPGNPYNPSITATSHTQQQHQTQRKLHTLFIIKSKHPTFGSTCMYHNHIYPLLSVNIRSCKSILVDLSNQSHQQPFSLSLLPQQQQYELK